MQSAYNYIKTNIYQKKLPRFQKPSISSGLNEVHYQHVLNKTQTDNGICRAVLNR